MRFTAVILSALLCLSGEAFAAKKKHKTEVDQAADDAIVAAAEQLVNESKSLKIEELKTEPVTEAMAAAASTGPAAKDLPALPAAAEKKESEIPIFTKSEKVEKSESSLLWRLGASMAMLILVGGALIYGTKRYSRTKSTTAGKVRIEVLHKHQLTPKNSLALVRVAGEAILIGCSDHSVNMLKTITLIDDELEGLLGGKDFNGFLEDDFKIEDVRNALEQRA